MFKLDMDAIRKGAKQQFKAASVANAANLLTVEPQNHVPISRLATLAVLAGQNSEKPVDQSLISFRLMAAAMQVCDRHGDGPEAREDMRRDMLETPEHLKAELLERLRFNQPPAKSASAPPPAPPVPPAPRPKAELDESWRVLDAAYLAHHFACKTCIAAGQGRGLRCGVGSALWVSYTEAAMTPTTATKANRTTP